MRGASVRSFLHPWGVTLVLLALASCSSVPPHPRVAGLDEGFSGEMARAHVEALASLTPRLAGSREDRLARAYLMRELQLAGLEVEEVPAEDGMHLLACLGGVSADELLLVAAYPTLAKGNPVDDTGAAVLLEMARVFGSQAEPPYSLRFAFSETRPSARHAEASQVGDSREPDRPPVSAGAASRERVVVAGRSLAAALEARGELEGLRGVIVLDRVGGSGLRVARDLRSHPVFREIFWESATALGLEAAFPREEGWASSEGLHIGFRERGMDRLVVLTDEAVVRPDHARAGSSSEVSAATLEAVGVVGVEALGRIMQRLSKIDAFSR